MDIRMILFMSFVSSVVTGYMLFRIGVMYERGEWNKLITAGKIPRPFKRG